MAIKLNKTSMMKKRYDIKANQLTDTVEDIFSVYTAEIIEEVKEATKDTADEIQLLLLERSPKNHGEYAYSWDTKTVFENSLEIREAVYNDGHYQLIHLLEFGHESYNGFNKGGQSYKFVPAIPHVMPTWEEGGKIYMEKVKEAIENAK